MTDSQLISQAELWPVPPRVSRWRKVGAVLDHWSIQATFGFVLPMIFALGTAILKLLVVAPTGWGPAGYFVLFCWLLTVAFGFIFGFSVLTDPLGQRRSVPLAIALSIGTALAGCSALACTAVAVPIWLSVGFERAGIHLIWFVLPPMPLAACVVYSRAACRAWAASGTRAAVHPRWTVLAIAIGFLVVFAAIAAACLMTG